MRRWKLSLVVAVIACAGCRDCSKPHRGHDPARDLVPLGLGPTDDPLVPVRVGDSRILVGEGESEFFRVGDPAVTTTGRVTMVNGRSVSLDMRGATAEEAVSLMRMHPTATASMRIETSLLCDDAVTAKLGDIGTMWFWLKLDDDEPDVGKLAECLAPLGVQELFLELRVADDAAVARAARIPSLRGLGLARTAVTDEGLASLSKKTDLRWLDLRDTSVTGEGLAVVHDLPALLLLETD